MKYTPVILDEKQIAIAIRTNKCLICKGRMARLPKGWEWSEMFYMENYFDEQLSRAGILVQSNTTVDGKHICKKCDDAGLAYFICYLCEMKQQTNEIKFAYGDPYPDYLCKTCYSNQPAEKWENAVSEIEEKHRWDFE